jgi:hypothetical protein
MKQIIFAFLAATVFLIGFSSCGNKKNDSSAENPNMMMDGEVVISQKDGECALWIMTTKTSSFAGFYPVNLDDQFKVNGLKIAFNYSDSRAPLPESCQTLKAIVISEVKILK